MDNWLLKFMPCEDYKAITSSRERERERVTPLTYTEDSESGGGDDHTPCHLGFIKLLIKQTQIK